MREWMNRLIDVFRRNTLDRELAEELEFHARHLERDAADEGLTPEAARLKARRQLGNLTAVAEDTRTYWSFRWMDHLRQDLRFAWRGLRRTPGFTATVVLVLSLGIGANAVMFGVVDRLTFRPLDYLRDPGSVNRLYFQTLNRGNVSTSLWVQAERYRDLLNGTTSFAQMACVNERTMAVGTGDSLRDIRVAGVTASYFELFDAAPVAGRFFGPSEDVAPTGSPVVVVAHSYWEAHGRRHMLGETMMLGNTPVTVIGIAPPGFTGLDAAQPVQMFLPISALGPAMGGRAATHFSSGFDFLYGTVIARRKAGVGIEAASLDATQAFRMSWQKQRELSAPGGFPVPPLDEAQPAVVVSALRMGGGPDPSLDARVSWWVSGVAALLLVITIANVANLLLGRTMERRQETAVRLALGVSRSRLVAHLLTESALLSLLGALGAVAVAYWAGAAVFALLVSATGIVPGFLDPRTSWATAAVTALVAVVTGVIPAWIVSRASLAPALGSGARVVRNNGRVRTGLVVTQAALSLMLVVGAVLFVGSLRAVRAMHLGYEPDRIVMVNRVWRGAPMPREQQMAVRLSLMEAARRHPAVEAVAWRTSVPLGLSMTLGFSADGVASVSALGQFSAQEGTADYFRVMGTRILRGRPFTDEDRAGTPRVAVLSESAARLLWPGQLPLGRCLRVGRPPADCTEVIGVAEDIVSESLTASDRLQVYLPLEQTSPNGGGGMFVRVRGEAATAAESLRRALQPVMPGTSYVTAQPMTALLTRPQRSWRLGATMFGAFGVLALLIAAIGLYAVISHDAAQRRREVGVRLALGAARRDIIWLVTRQGLWVAAAGVAAGVGLALLCSGQLQPMLYGQSARDPRVYAAAAGVLLCVAVLATIVPALRASGENPTEVLRGE
jgi:putative ABC transport system permease protein